VYKVVALTAHSVFCQPGPSSFLRDVGVTVQQRQADLRRVEKEAEKVVINVPPVSLTGVRRLIIWSGLFLGSEVDDERVAVPGLTTCVDTVLGTDPAAAHLDKLLPCLGAELGGRHLAMTWEVLILGPPGGFVVWIHVHADP
jgi:hypothetical protein